MDLESVREKVNELLSLTENIAHVVEQDEPNAELIIKLITKRQDIIDVLFDSEEKATDTDIREIYKKIYELDLKNASRIKQILDTYSQTLINTANKKKQISYYPKKDYSEGLFIDKRN